MQKLIKIIHSRRKDSGKSVSWLCILISGLSAAAIGLILWLQHRHNAFPSAANTVSNQVLPLRMPTVHVPPVGTGTKEKSNRAFSATRQKAYEVLRLIYERYEFHNSNWLQLFLMMYNMPDHTWDILKYKLALKLLASNGKQGKNKDVFRLLFVGSSVTAGYDNYFNHSYPQIIKKRLQSVFKAANIDLDIRNVGQHRVNCMLQTHCLPSLMDISRADILGYENSYACGRNPELYEFMARLAFQYGGVLFVAASGGMSAQSCAPSRDPIPYSSEDWKPVSKPSLLAFNESYVAFYREQLSAWHTDTFNVGKFTRGLFKPYKGVGIHGFNMFAKSQRLCSYNHLIRAFLTSPSAASTPHAMGGCESSELFHALCHDNGGLKFLTKEASFKGAQDGGGKNKAGEEAVGNVVAKGWNPSRAMHLLRGELMAFSYILILLDAMRMIEKDKMGLLADDEDVVLAKNYQMALDKLRGAVPAQPIHCSSQDSVQTEVKPSVTSSASLIPCLLPARTPQCFTLYQPMHTMRTNSLKNITVGEHDGWIVDEFTGGIDMQKYGYKDHKYFLRGVVGGNALHIKILNVKFGVVKLFGLGAERLKVKGIQIILDPNVPNIRRASSYTPSNNIEQVNAFSQYDAESDSYEIRRVPKGDHVLTILTPIDASQTEATTLTHVVVY